MRAPPVILASSQPDPGDPPRPPLKQPGQPSCPPPPSVLLAGPVYPLVRPLTLQPTVPIALRTRYAHRYLKVEPGVLVLLVRISLGQNMRRSIHRAPRRTPRPNRSFPRYTLSCNDTCSPPTTCLPYHQESTLRKGSWTRIPSCYR